VTAICAAAALGPAFERDPLDAGRDGFTFSGVSRDSTVPFEQIGQSAVKRLWRQKSEDTNSSEDTLRRVVTAVLSDLHLGTRSQADVLRRPEIRETLFAGLADADEIVLLGDVVELREQALPEVLEIALPFFEELGEALPDKRITILAGNHDHNVVADWLEELRLAGKELGLEQRTDPAASRIAREMAKRMPRNTVELAYPGVWLRPGTYAHHGHYIDAHMSIPRLEAIAVSATARVTGGMPPPPRTPDDYEAAMTPLYAFAYALAQGSSRARRVLGMDFSRKMWKRIDTGRGLGGRTLRGLAIPSAVFALNRAGMGPFEAKITGARLRESGLEAMRDLIRALEIDANEIVFGHTHRPGPLPQDNDWDPRLFNTGSWLYEPNLLQTTAGESPYWPGCVLFIEDDKPPELRRLLLDISHAELGAHHAYS
jgi:UDP-2,3-diacylglucosamine pyrophosphatase LpxH